MPSYSDASSLAWQVEPVPISILFISHRWRSTSQPDPDGRTLRAICQVIRCVELLARGLDPQDSTPAPNLGQPAMLQASVLLYRMLERRDLDGRQMVDGLAVFFDYSCIPQGCTVIEAERLRSGLASLPAIIPDSTTTLLALREPDDTYASRAWCVAESVLSLQYDEDRRWIYSFPLRIGLDLESTNVVFEPLRSEIDSWSKTVEGVKHLTEKEFRRWLQVVQLCVDWHEHAREEAVQSLHHSSEMAERSFGLWAAVTTRLANEGKRVVDLAALLPEFASTVGLECSNPDDLLPTALIILAGLRWEELNRNSGSPQTAADSGIDFWRLCLARVVQGKSLRVLIAPRVARARGALVTPKITFLDG